MLARPTTVDLLREATEQYDADDSARVSLYLREQALAEEYVSKYEKRYRSVIRADEAEGTALGRANGRWAQELVATAEKRLWFRIASEMHWMPEYKTVGDLLNQAKSDILSELISVAASHQSHAESMEKYALLLRTKVDEVHHKVSASTDILVNLEAMYQALIPFSFRWMVAM